LAGGVRYIEEHLPRTSPLRQQRGLADPDVQIRAAGRGPCPGPVAACKRHSEAVPRRKGVRDRGQWHAHTNGVVRNERPWDAVTVTVAEVENAERYERRSAPGRDVAEPYCQLTGRRLWDDRHLDGGLTENLETTLEGR